MKDRCPMLARVEALETGQKQQSADLKNICANVQRMADSMEKLVSIVPLISMAQAFRAVAVWMTPVIGLVAACWGGYWALGKVFGYG